MDLKNKTVMVVGTGISGIGAVDLLNKVGADCILYDGNEKLDRQKVQEKLGDNKAEIIIGAFDESLLPKIDLLVISPGVPIDSPIVLTFKNAGIPVWGEIELAYNYDKGKVIAITGTNGKTTTTALVGQIIAAYNEKTFVVGNIGNSYTGEVLKTSEDSYTVAEISSFQLETVHEFHPIVSAILNITPDHLNRHHTMECYAWTKERISENQTKADTCVLNLEDKYLTDFAPECKADEHRIEYVATKNGVDYYNDSKGTNPEAAVKAIEAMVKPTILIGGGYDKGSEFDLYVKAFKDKVKLLVLIGQTSAKIADTCKKYGFDNIEYADSMEQVVDICAKNAVSGDAVLLSPACASWGMFDNYEQRGRIFKDLVNNL